MIKYKLILTVIITFMLSTTLLTMSTPEAAAATDWLEGYEYRKELTINQTVGLGTNYQIPLNVHRTSGYPDSGNDVYIDPENVRSDFLDVRFTSSDGTTELDFYLNDTTTDYTDQRIPITSAPSATSFLLDPNATFFAPDHPGQWDDYVINDADVFIIDDTYYMLYYAMGEAYGVRQIGLATSSNGNDWTRYEGNPVIPVTPGAWDAHVVAYGRVMRDSAGDPLLDGGYYWMYYTGDDNHGTTAWDIGLAKTTDFMTWTKVGEVFSHTGSGWEQYAVGLPYVWKEGSTYYMMYSGLTTDDGYDWQVGMAYSTNRVDWTRGDNNPVIEFGAGGTWDSERIYSSFVLKDGSDYYTWYGGKNATTPYWFGGAYSTDPMNTWTKSPTTQLYQNDTTRNTDHAAIVQKDGYWCAYTVSGNNTWGVGTNWNSITWGWLYEGVASTGLAHFLVEVSGDLDTGDQTIYIYYDYPTMGVSASNAEDTFTYYDDFLGSALDATWNTTTHNDSWIIVSDSILNMTTGQSGAVDHCYAHGGEDLAMLDYTLIEYSAKWGPEEVGIRSIAGLTNGTGAVDLYGTESMRFQAREGAWDTYAAIATNSTGSGVVTDLDKQYSDALNTTYSTHQITKMPTEMKYYLNGTLVATQTTYLPTVNFKTVGLRLETSGSQSVNNTLLLDYVLVRKYITPLMTLTWGAETGGPTYFYTFNGLYSELNGTHLGSVNVTVYEEGYAPDTFEVTESSRVGFWTVPTYAYFDLPGESHREYWFSADEDDTTIYIFTDTDLTSYTVVFADLTNILDEYSYIEARVSVNGTYRTCEKRKADIEKKVAFNMKSGRKYSIYISDGLSYEYGELLFTSTTTVQLTLTGLEFPSTITEGYKYLRVWGYRDYENPTDIIVNYQDLTSTTNNVSITYYFTNDTVAYETYSIQDIFISTWTGADENTTYYVVAEIDRTSGTTEYRNVFGRSYSSNPWGIDFLWPSAPFDTDIIIPAFIILCVAGLFSSLNVRVGAFATVATAIIVIAIWGLPVAPELILLAVILVIILAIAKSRERVVVT